MRKSTNALTPTQVYRYTVESCQPHLKLGDTKRVTSMSFHVKPPGCGRLPTRRSFARDRWLL